MTLWRISNYADLEGGGGIKTPGRWHNKGIPIVYLSETPALAMLEVLVHFEMAPNDVPETYQLLEVEFPDKEHIWELSEESLPENWQANQAWTRSAGDEWLSGFENCLLRVPSAIVPHSYNYLLNPRHELAGKAEIVSVQSHPFDVRLI